MVFPDEEKLKFLKTSVLWIEGKDIIDTCFFLNFGYDSPLPWPQVLYRHVMCILRIDLMIFDKQVRMADEDLENGLQLQGMNIPSACTIVIIAG